MKEPFLTVAELAKRWNCSQSSIYALVAARKLQCVRIGVGRGSIRFSEDHAAAYLRAAEQGRAGESVPPSPPGTGRKPQRLTPL